MFANLDDVGCVIKNENGLESFCQVKCKIVFEDTIIYRANFENTTFFNDVIFSNTKFIWYAKFANSVFNGEATFKSLKFKDELNEQDKYILNLCQNKSLSVFSDETIEVSINNTIDFTNTVFNSNVCFDSLNTEPTHNEEKYTEYPLAELI